MKQTPRPEPLLRQEPKAAPVSGLRMAALGAVSMAAVAGMSSYMGLFTLTPAKIGTPMSAPSAATAHQQSQNTSNQNISSATPSGESNSGHARIPDIGMVAQVALIAPEHAEAALRKAGYSKADQAAIMAGLDRRDYRLVTLPVFDWAGGGGAVTIQSGPVTRVVKLGANPVSVVLPIVMSGQIAVNAIAVPGPQGIQPGALTITGPIPLPVLHQGDGFTAEVFAQ